MYLDEPFIVEREFIGYGYNTPDPKWPKQAKIAVNFLVNFNMGAESNPLLLLGDPFAGESDVEGQRLDWDEN